MLHGLQNRSFGNLVEDHPLGRQAGQRLLFLKQLLHMPADRLSLTIRVRRQNEAISPFQRFGQGNHLLGGGGICLPDHLKISIRIDRTVLGRQVAHMAIRG